MMALVIVVTTALALFASNDKQRIVFSDSCDYVEINNVYNTNEETREHTLRMTQYIWWEWRDRILLPVLDPITKQETGDWKSGSDFVVREFLVIFSNSSSPNNTNGVLLDKRKDHWICIFWDKNDKVMRKVRCKWLATTHTTYDVEIKNRDIVKQERRNHFQKR